MRGVQLTSFDISVAHGNNVNQNKATRAVKNIPSAKSGIHKYVKRPTRIDLCRKKFDMRTQPEKCHRMFQNSDCISQVNTSGIHRENAGTLRMVP